MTQNSFTSGPEDARKQSAAERKPEETPLKHTQPVLENILENFPGIVFWKDRSLVYRGCNKNFAAVAGFSSPDELQGKTDYEIPGVRHDAEKYRADDQEVLASGRPRLNIIEKLQTADGTVRLYSTNKVPLLDADGQVIGVLGAGNDITEQKRAEEALKAEHDQLLSIFDSIDETIYVSDPYTYEVLFVNRWGQKRQGKEAIGGKCYREFQGRMLPCDFCTNAIILQDKGKPYYWEYHNPLFNRDYWIVDKIIKWPDGRDVRFEMALDITEHKQALADAEEAKARAELYLDLMSHDLTNMNQAILGHLELMEALLEPGSSERELADISVEIIRRSARMINNVKKLTEIEAGKVPLRAVDLCAILSQVVSEYSAQDGQTVRIRARICQKCEVMAGDMLREVFENLVDNAIRHAGGPVIVDIAVDRIARNGQGYYQVSVADNGPGIPDELKRKLFQSARELEKKTERRGFGIYVIRALIEYYQGKVWVEDRVPGDYTQGCRFVVLLPENRSTATSPRG